jgi:hypothetical protein
MLSPVPSDLHRTSLPASDPSRLPSYFLRLLLEGVVLVSGIQPAEPRQKTEAYLPILPSVGPRHEK